MHGGTAVATGAGGLNQTPAITYTGRNGTVYSSTTAPTAAGDYTASATFGGDANHDPCVTTTADFTIAKAPLTVTAANTQRMYGAANPAVGYMLTGFIAPDTAAMVSGNAVCTTSGAAGPNAGTYLNANSCAAGSLQAANYNFTFAAGTLTIDPLLSSTTTVTAANAVYDGQPHGASSATATGAGLNQTLSVTYSGRNGTVYSALIAPTNTGDYTASATFAGDATHAPSSNSADFTIAKATLIVTAANTQRAYGAANPPVGYALTGFLAPDTAAVVSGTPVCTTSASAGPNAGTYLNANSCAAGSLQAANYAFTFAAGTLTISSAPAATPINLNVATSPGSGKAGTFVNLTGSGFPAGTILPASVTVTLSAACGGAPVASTPATSVVVVLGTTRRIQVKIPTVAPGTYQMSASGFVTGGASFASTNCSVVTVAP